MKTVISVAVALALVLSVVPAIAGEDTFRALSSMAAGEQELLTPLSDEQLAAIEGAAYTLDGYGKDRYGKKYDGYGKKYDGYGDVCVVCSNTAKVTQANVNDFGSAFQTNSASVRQSNN